MADESAQQQRSKRARPSLQPPAVATGATKFSRSSSCGAAAPSQEPAASFNLRRPRSSSAGAGMGTVATHDGRSRLLQYVAAFDYNVHAPHTVLWRGSG